MSSETKLSLGEFLRQERERKGLTIEQVASATKISVRLLHALEGDLYQELPAKPFIRGFVASYCRFVGLDSREILTQFSSYIDTRSQDRPNRESGHSGYAFEKREGDQGSRTLLGIVMGGFVVVGIVAFAVFKPASKHHRGTHVDKLRAVHSFPSPTAQAVSVASPSATPQTSPAASPISSPSPSLSPSSSPKSSAKPSPKPTVKPSPSPSALPSASPAPSPTASPTPSPEDPLNNGAGLKRSEIKYKLMFKAYESVWVRYQVDDRKMMKFILKKGRILLLRAQASVRFQVSNPKHVSFSYEGRNYPTLDLYRSAKVLQGDLSIVIPREGSEIIEDPFPGESPISKRPVPLSPSPDPVPSPSP